VADRTFSVSAAGTGQLIGPGREAVEQRSGALGDSAFPEAVAHQQAGLSALDRPDLPPTQSIPWCSAIDGIGMAVVDGADRWGRLFPHARIVLTEPAQGWVRLHAPRGAGCQVLHPYGAPERL